MKTPIQSKMSSTFVSSFGGGGELETSGVQMESTLEGRVSFLEARPTMPAKGADAAEDDVLTLDAALRSRWTPGLAGITYPLTDCLVYWDVSLKKFKNVDVPAPTALAHHLAVWDTSTTDFKWIEVPAEIGKSLITRESTAGETALEFDYLKWR